MKRRTILKNQLIKVWAECVDFDYPNGVVNGERALQACLYHRLTEQFKTDEMADRRRIFIEPTIYAKGRTWRRIPDMVICDTRNVIAVVELKFHPRATLSGQLGDALRDGAEKDLETLLGVAQDLNDVSMNTSTVVPHITVSNERYLGVHREIRPYGLASNLLLVWAGIYKQSEGRSAPSTERLARVFEDAGVTIQGGLLELHAQTKAETPPVLIERYSGWKTSALEDSDEPMP
jgi:hypothetical protein